MWITPKRISAPSKPIAGSTNTVTTVISAATPTSLIPRRKLLWERREEAPQITMNSPAKSGSSGEVSSSRTEKVSKLKNSPAV